MKTFPLRLSSIAMATALALGATNAGATSVLWYLHDVTMSGGTSLDGTFTTDSTTGDITAWNIFMVGGPYGGGTGYHFSNTIPSNFIGAAGPESFEIFNSTASNISWSFVSSLASRDEGVLDITAADFSCSACDGYFVSGESGFASTPEPATWAIMLAGIAGVGAVFRRSRKGRAVRQIRPA